MGTDTTTQLSSASFQSFQLLLVLVALLGATPTSALPSKLNGICYASWASQGADSYTSIESDASLARLSRTTGANFVSIVQTWYMTDQNTTSIAPSKAKTNSDDGVRRAIAVARQNGLEVALKPHVDFLSDDAHWRGEIGPAFSDADWATWFESYTEFMLQMAAIAVESHIPLFIVGTELVSTVSEAARWHTLIAALRNATASASPPMQFVYGANWSPGPQHVSWWSALDFIGVDAYYPVATHASPSAAELAQGWSPIVAALAKLSAANGNKPVIVVEVGYTTTDKCAMGNHAGGDRSTAAQALAYSAALDAVYSQPWCAGVFFWDWETNPFAGGRCDGGAFSFTPAGKPAAAVLKQRFANTTTTTATTTSSLRATAAAAAAAAPPSPPPHLVYRNGALTKGWQDYSYNGKSNLRATDEIYGNDTSGSAFFSGTNFGALSFHNGDGVVVPSHQPDPSHFKLALTSYTALQFAIHSSNASGNEIQVALYGSKDASHPFSPTFVSEHTADCALPTAPGPSSWVLVVIPLLVLLPPFDPTPPPPPAPTPGCADVSPPPGTYTCAQQKGWGKCDVTANPWIAGYCCKTCFDCAAGCGKTAAEEEKLKEEKVEDNPDSVRITRVEIKANYATGSGEFWIDDLAFV